MQTQLEKVQKHLKKRMRQHPIKILKERHNLLNNPRKNRKELDKTLKTLEHLINHPEPFIPALLFKAVEVNDFDVVELLCKSKDSLKYIQFTENYIPFAPFILALDSLEYFIAALMIPTLTQYLKDTKVPGEVYGNFRYNFNHIFNFLLQGFKSSQSKSYFNPLKVILDHAQEWINDHALLDVIKNLIKAHQLVYLKELFPYGKNSFILGKTYSIENAPVCLASASVLNEVTEFKNPEPSIVLERLKILLYILKDMPQIISDKLSYELSLALTKLLEAINKMENHPDLDKARSKGMECFLNFVKVGAHKKWCAVLQNNPLHFAVKYNQKDATGIILSTLPFNESLLHMNSEGKTPIEINPDLFRDYVMEQVYPLYKLCFQALGGNFCKELRDYIAFLFLYFYSPILVVIKTLEQKHAEKQLSSFLINYISKNNKLFSKIPYYERELISNFCPTTLRDYLLAVYKKKRTPEDAQLITLLCTHRLINNSLIQIFKENNEILTKTLTLALFLVSGPEYVEDTIKLGLNIHDFLKIHFSGGKNKKPTDTLFQLLLDKNLIEKEKIPIYEHCMNYFERFNFLNTLMLPGTIGIPINLEKIFSRHVPGLLEEIYNTDNNEFGGSERILIEFLEKKGLINEQEHDALRMAREGEHKRCKLN